MYYPNEAIELWEGNRGIQEYAREAFLVEERANGMTWMDEDSEMEDIDEEDESARGSKEGSVSEWSIDGSGCSLRHDIPTNHVQ